MFSGTNLLQVIKKKSPSSHAIDIIMEFVRHGLCTVILPSLDASNFILLAGGVGSDEGD